MPSSMWVMRVFSADSVSPSEHNTCAVSVASVRSGYGSLTDNPVLRRPLEPGQFVSLAFGQKARDAGIAVSMGSKGCAYDNAVAESFFATLKKELVHRRSWRTRRELISEVFEFVEAFYNTTRRHSTLGYLSPAQFETMTTIKNNKENG
jgi:transposase InsO family protein